MKNFKNPTENLKQKTKDYKRLGRRLVKHTDDYKNSVLGNYVIYSCKDIF